MRRSSPLLRLGALAALWIVASDASAAQLPSQPRVSLRADHMVLDAAVHAGRGVVATQSGRIEAFDWRAGGELSVLLSLPTVSGREFPPTLSSVDISPSGRRLAAISSDGLLLVLRFDEMGRLSPVARHRRPAPLLVRFVDEERVLLGDMRGALTLFDLRSQREVYRRQIEYDPVYALEIDPKGGRVAVAFRSSRVHVVDLESGAGLETLEGHRDSVYAVAWLGPDRLASAGKGKRVLLWDLARSDSGPRLVYHEDHYITALAFDAVSGRMAITLEGDGVGMLDLESGRITRRLEGHTAPVQRLIFLDRGRKLLSTGNDARVLVWSLAEDADRGTVR